MHSTPLGQFLQPLRARPPVLARELHHLIPPDSPLDPIALPADHVFSLCLPGGQRPLIHPPRN